MNRKQKLSGLGVNVMLLGIVSLFNDLSSEMIMPILPLFIVSLGGAGIIVGLVGGVRDSLSSILKVLCGWWSDRSGKRKVFVASGYFSSAVFKLLLAFSQTWQHILAFAGLERVGKGLRTAARDAIISDSMPEQRGKGFGIHRAMDTAGAIFGSLFVFYLYHNLNWGFRDIILLAGGVAFISLVPLSFVKETPARPRPDLSLNVGLKEISPELRRFILIAALFSLGNFSYMFFLLRAGQSIGGDEGAALSILLYVLFNVFYSAFAVPFGILSDRIGRRKVLITGYALFGVTALGFAAFSSFYAFIGLFALYGMVNAIVDGNQRAFVSDLSGKEQRATALGTYHTAVGLVALPASLIAGGLYEGVGPRAAFIYGAVLGLAAAVVFAVRK